MVFYNAPVVRPRPAPAQPRLPQDKEPRTPPHCGATGSRAHSTHPTQSSSLTDSAPWGSTAPAHSVRAACAPNKPRARPVRLRGLWTYLRCRAHSSTGHHRETGSVPQVSSPGSEHLFWPSVGKALRPGDEGEGREALQHLRVLGAQHLSPEWA